MGKLKWSLRDDVHQDVKAETPVGTYAVQVEVFPKMRFMAIWYPSSEPIRIVEADLTSLDEAKAACQSHYDHVVAQIMEAEGLRPVTSRECVVDKSYVMVMATQILARLAADASLGFDVEPMRRAANYLDSCLQGKPCDCPAPEMDDPSFHLHPEKGGA